MKKVIAVFNTSEEITDMLEEVLAASGFQAYSMFTFILKNDYTKFTNFLKKYQPDVILYDIAIPYEENFDLFRKLSSLKEANGIPFILTTTNKEALEKLVGETPAYELMGKPYDLEEIIKAIKHAIKKK